MNIEHIAKIYGFDYKQKSANCYWINYKNTFNYDFYLKNGRIYDRQFFYERYDFCPEILPYAYIRNYSFFSHGFRYSLCFEQLRKEIVLKFEYKYRRVPDNLLYLINSFHHYEETYYNKDFSLFEIRYDTTNF